MPHVLHAVRSAQDGSDTLSRLGFAPFLPGSTMLCYRQTLARDVDPYTPKNPRGIRSHCGRAYSLSHGIRSPESTPLLDAPPDGSDH